MPAPHTPASNPEALAEARHAWTDGAPRVYHAPPRTALAVVRDLNASDPYPFHDERLALAAMGLPPLADDDDLPSATTHALYGPTYRDDFDGAAAELDAQDAMRAHRVATTQETPR